MKKYEPKPYQWEDYRLSSWDIEVWKGPTMLYTIMLNDAKEMVRKGKAFVLSHNAIKIYKGNNSKDSKEIV